MKIVLLVVLAMAAVTASTALASRKVDQHEGNELQDPNVEEDREKRHLFRTHLLQSSRVSVNEFGTKVGLREMTHNTIHQRYGGRPLLGLGSGLSHNENRRVFSAGIAGPLGAIAIHRDSYNRDLRFRDEK